MSFLSTGAAMQRLVALGALAMSAGLLPALTAGAENSSPSPQVLDGTQPLELGGDLAAVMVAGVDRFLLRQTAESIERRAAFWNRDTSSAEAHHNSVEPNRQRLAKIIGVRDPRPHFEDLELVASSAQPALVGQGEGYDIYTVRWPAIDGVDGEGLWLEPTARTCLAQVVAIPDCAVTPEALAGLEPGVNPESQFARRLAESGCRVLIPVLMNRDHELSSIADGQRRADISHRELLYRAAFQMGRHIIGYEVQKVLAAIDWFNKQSPESELPIAVVGHGEGGLIALYSAALDARIDVAGVSGYFNSRQGLWQEPGDRNVFGLLREFGDAEIASLIAPRTVIVEASQIAGVEIPPGTEGAPGRLVTPDKATVQAELQRAKELVAGLKPDCVMELVATDNGTGPPGSEPFLKLVLEHLCQAPLASDGPIPDSLRKDFDPGVRLARQYLQMSDFSQNLVDRGDVARNEFTKSIQRHSGLPAFEESTQPFRETFRNEIIGSYDDQPRLPPNARTRLLYDDPDFLGYEVVIDVFDDVVLYGILLLPKDLEEGKPRPVVVCQHGLEGRAQFTVQDDYTSYRNFASRLAKRGFVVFAPQHLYRGGDQFRTLQRKANPLKKSLFAIMTAQHRQLLDWLAGRDFVDPQHIAFYGISYGGKSAMRIPAQVDGYCLSICSSDFSDWIWRTASNRFPGGYLAHAEYEIFEFNLGNTFNYAEMAALICPRPFMVERFHPDGLFAEKTCAEFSQAQLLYQNLGIEDRIAMTYYGPFLNTMPYEDRETFDFLERFLNEPIEAADDTKGSLKSSSK